MMESIIRGKEGKLTPRPYIELDLPELVSNRVYNVGKGNDGRDKVNIQIIDMIMGSGKTTSQITWMLETKQKFLYITPFLSEIEQLKVDVPGLYEPTVATGKGSKMESLKSGLDKGLNMISTHALFSKLRYDQYELLNDRVLILDEAVEPVSKLRIPAKDIEVLLQDGILILDKESGRVRYDENRKLTRYTDLIESCNTSYVYYVSNILLMWNFPVEVFTSFKGIRILTYGFMGSILRYYFDLYGIEYTHNLYDDKKVKMQVQGLLNIYSGAANRRGEGKTAFSKAWIQRLPTAYKESIGSTTGRIMTLFGTEISENAWTTFKGFKDKLKGRRYTRGFISLGTRATNDYRHVKSMAYLANNYVDPNIIHFFSHRGVEVDQDRWALNLLIQWLWRGCIRDGKRMNVFIPSRRMRGLLVDWLEGE